MTESQVRQIILDYYGNKATHTDISRFISNAKMYSRQMIVGNKQDTLYPNGVILTTSLLNKDRSAEYDFQFEPRNFGSEDMHLNGDNDFHTNDLDMGAADSTEVNDTESKFTSSYTDEYSTVANKRAVYWNKVLHDFANRTSNSVGCKSCKMRISKSDALSYNLVCPRCNSLLVNDTIKGRLKRFDDKLTSLGEKSDTGHSITTNEISDTGVRLQDLLIG